MGLLAQLSECRRFRHDLLLLSLFVTLHDEAVQFCIVLSSKTMEKTSHVAGKGLESVARSSAESTSRDPQKRAHLLKGNKFNEV